jgi:D-serine deaminase-like pyridoxal phosphate-dependent protein
MENSQSWYRIDNESALDSPALVVYPNRVMSNIRTAIRMAGDASRLRPHIKTHKCPDVISLMMNEGIAKFKCATIAETEILCMSGAVDVLLAYQPMGPKLQRLVQLIEQYPSTKISCLVDNKGSADEQSEVFAANGFNVPVYIDLNVGMNRTGIAPGQPAIELYEYCNTKEGITAIGLHAYDGHIRNVDFELRTLACDNGFAPVESIKEQLERRGMSTPIIIAGGSHSFPIHCKRASIECSPGTFVYWDKSNSDYCPEQAFLPAAALVTRIVSLPDKNKICIDLGHKSVAAENEITKRVTFLNAPGLVAVSQSEEHLVVETSIKHSYKTGDVLYGLPYHVCPTVALYERAYTIENGQVTGEWSNTARDRKINI